MLKIETGRLILFPLTSEQLQLLVSDRSRFERSVSFRYDGEPPEGEMERILKGQVEPVHRAGENFVWLTFWMMALRETGTIIGSIDFKNIPDTSECVEIGYGINPKYRHNGYTTEAVEGMLRWAFQHPHLRIITAEVNRSNTASQRVLQKNGFRKYLAAGECDWYHVRKENFCLQKPI